MHELVEISVLLLVLFVFMDSVLM